MAEHDVFNFSTLDSRLNGFKVNRVMANYVENEIGKNIDEYGTKKIFNKILQLFHLKKEFSSFVKERGASEEKSYAPFIKKKKHVFELLRNAIELAKIFKTEEEDRTNKKHRKCIIKILPYLKKIGNISLFFSPEVTGVARLRGTTLSKIVNGNFKREYPHLKSLELFLKKYIFLTKDIL